MLSPENVENWGEYGLANLHDLNGHNSAVASMEIFHKVTECVCFFLRHKCSQEC